MASHRSAEPPAAYGIAADGGALRSVFVTVEGFPSLGLATLDPGWSSALDPVRPQMERLETFLEAESGLGRSFLPDAGQVLRAFTREFDAVQVLLVGQDPYPTPGHPVGLSFSVAPQVHPLPRSLHNIFRELVGDIGVPMPSNGDLSPWADRGVLLLNRVLTIRPGESGSHRRIGWEQVTDQAVRALAARGRPLVAVLWGRDAQALRPLLADVPLVESVHPSPLSAARGFFGSRPFSRVNSLLTAQGAAPIDWRLP